MSMMKLFKFFSLLYLLSLAIFLFFLDHTKNVQIILVFQLVLGIYLVIIKKYVAIVSFLFCIFIVEFILIKKNIYLKDDNAIGFKEKNINIYESLSIIKYLYVKKYKPLSIGDKKIIPLTNLKNSKIYNGRIGNYLTYNITDDLGFFNEKNISSYHYIFLGDSFLNFAEIETEKSFINLLRNKTIYNMSLANSGPLSQLALIKEFIDLNKFKNVKKVVWFHSEENDIARPYVQYENRGGDLNIEYSLTLLKQYLNTAEFKQNISSNINEINSKLKKKNYIQPYNNNINEKRNFFLINFFSNSVYFLRKFLNKPKKELIRNFEEDEVYYNSQLDIVNNILISMDKFLDQKKIELTIIILPDKFNCSINKSHFLNKKLLKILKSNNINYIDGKKAFVKGETCNERNFNRNGHFSPLGHINMSNFLKKKIF